ncbi:MAG: helicase [Paenibacillaceae bacterium]|jgi:SNF2 family DNA or RNA helicase|nr:helicase [Paenibacillaceae bacterium]
MSFQLTKRVIKQLCGQTSYSRGEDYFLDNKVSFSKFDPASGTYEATVKGTDQYQVDVWMDRNGDVDAECTCPAFFTYDNYCKHIAAVLLDIRERQHGDDDPVRSYAPSLSDDKLPLGLQGQLTPRFISPPDAAAQIFSDSARSASARSAPAIAGSVAGDSRLLRGMMELFTDRPTLPTGMQPRIDTRTALDVEFVLKLFLFGYRRSLFGLELRIGPKRLYIVQKIRDFLDHLEQGKSVVFAKNFTYEPKLHGLREADDAVIQQLKQIYRQDKLYKEINTSLSFQSRLLSGERMLLIPPYAWESFAGLLAQAPLVKVEVNSRIIPGLSLSAEPLPLQFEFDEVPQAPGYQMAVHGLDELIVLDAYNIVIAGDRLVQVPPDQCKRLLELKQLLENSRREQVQIPKEQMESFMERAVPRLMKLGQVKISQTVSDKIVRSPLKARLYLDRVRNRLLAGLEFQYGDIVLNPLEGGAKSRGEDRILMRDGEREQAILELLERNSFARSESGYFMEDEEGEYEFLYHTVPQLEHLLEIYATSAVKTRLITNLDPPKVKVEVDERTDWLEFRFDLDGIPDEDIRGVLQSLVEKRRYHRLPNGALMPLETAEFQEITRMINELGMVRGDLTGEQLRLPAVRALHLQNSGSERNTVKLGKSLRQLLENMRNPDNLDFPVPDSLQTVLRDYQKYGYQWLKTLAYYRFGGILADDMGLGKTVQAITFLVSALPEIRSLAKPALIIAPASLVYNWRNELNRFAPDMKAVIADGTKVERSSAVKNLTQADVLITSYPLLRRDMELYAGRSFHTLILDEAQVFKNHATQTAQAVKELQAQYRFALTGTPVENRLEELWSIYDAVFPQLFPSRKAFNELPRESVARRIRPFLLRRLKRDVLKELPEKIESLQASELLPEQKKLYVAYLAQLQAETVKHLNEETFQKNRIKILAGLTRLRQLCCHPSLFVEGYDGGSAKFEMLLELIEECRSAGKRMLVFSQFTQMLSLIGRELGSQGVPFFYLDGSTPAADRVELCTRFNQGQRDLFLISLKAGGTGLNLTGADTVILYDLWWNPAVEEQAADRAHRIGQKNVVQVIRLVAQGTVEDKMYELQQRKKSLIDEVIQPGQESLSTLTEQEIREILSLAPLEGS